MANEKGIDFVDVLNVVGDFKRPIIEGQAILDAKHIIMCGVVLAKKDFIRMEALCLQTSNLKGIPHQIKVEVRHSVASGKVIQCICSCKAGNSGKCKHIVGTLLYIFRHTVDNLEDLSATDLKQEWGKLKNEKRLYEKATPISDFCHMGKSSKSSLDSRLAGNAGANILDILISGAEGSELELTLRSDIEINPVEEDSTYQDDLLRLSLCHGIVGNNNVLLDFEILLKLDMPLTENVAKFYRENVCVTYEDSVRLCMETITQTGCVWKNARSVRITGSNCYSFYTYSQNKNPNWTLKVNRILKSSFKGNKATFHGKKFETSALDAYEHAFGCRVEKLGIIVPPSAPWLGASLDGVSGKHCVEVKCPLKGRTQTATDVVESLNYLAGSIEDSTLHLKANHPYYGQIQLQMLLSGLEICHFIIYCSFDKTFIAIEVPFDVKFTTNMLEVLKFVYFTNVLPILCEMYA